LLTFGALYDFGVINQTMDFFLTLLMIFQINNVS